MSSSNNTTISNQPEPIFLTYLQGILCITGFLLNLLNYSVFTNIKIKAAPYTFLTALSLTDSITLLLKSSESLLKSNLITNPYMSIILYLFIVYVVVPLTNITESVSNWIAVLLAIERYIAMCFYNISKQYSTVENVKKFLLVSIIISTILNSPFFYSVICTLDWENETIIIKVNNITETIVKSRPTIITDFSPLTKSTYYTIYSWIHHTIVQFIPLIFLCLANFLLLVIVYKHNKQLKLSSSSQNKKSNSNITANQRKQRAQNKLTILLIVVILLFLIGQIPSAMTYIKIYAILPHNCGTIDKIPECLNYKLFRSISYILMSLCYCSNFFVYFSLNKHFRGVIINYRGHITKTFNQCTICSKNCNKNIEYNNNVNNTDNSLFLPSISPIPTPIKSLKKDQLSLSNDELNRNDLTDKRTTRNSLHPDFRNNYNDTEDKIIDI